MGGLLLKKRFRVNRNGVDADLDAEWSYDNDGKLTTVRYPLGAVYQHGYDEMGRPKTMIDAGTQTTVIGSATYGPAGELLTMGKETRQYNSRLQVTRITYPTQDWEYKYSAALNNGQITAMKDWTSGEEVNYAYDELKRLASAVTVGPEWGNSYVYDGFGNLLQKNVVKGSAPYMNLSIDPATNKPYSGYSAAGLPTVGAQFDNDDRMISTMNGSSYPELYAYAPTGERVWNRGKRQIDVVLLDVEEVWFWGVTGQRMAFYSLTASGNPVFTLTSTNLYMGSKLVAQGAGSSVTAVKTDRLGSVGKFYPWGEERTPTGASGEKFATYYHDVQAAMNYADQRWHGTNGRFQVPDPLDESATLDDPLSQNRFAYVKGDPINLFDPDGLDVKLPVVRVPGAPSCLDKVYEQVVTPAGFGVSDQSLERFINTDAGILGLQLWLEAGRSVAPESEDSPKYQAMLGVGFVFINRYLVNWGKEKTSNYSLQFVIRDGDPGHENWARDGNLTSGALDLIKRVLNAAPGSECGALIFGLQLGVNMVASTIGLPTGMTVPRGMRVYNPVGDALFYRSDNKLPDVANYNKRFRYFIKRISLANRKFIQFWGLSNVKIH